MVRFSSIEYHRKSIGFFGRRCAHHFPFDWFDWPFYFVSLSLYTFTSICQGTLAASDKRAILPYIIRFPSTILWFIIRQAVLAKRSPAHKVASYIILNSLSHRWKSPRRHRPIITCCVYVLHPGSIKLIESSAQPCVCVVYYTSPQHTSSPSTNNCIQAAWGYYLNVSPAPSVDITRAVNEISIKIAKCFTFSLTPWLYISDLIIVNLYHGQTSPILIESCLTIHQQVITHLLPYSSPPYRPPSFVVYLVVRSTFICLVW